MVIGIIVRPDALMLKNMIMAFVAVSFFPLSVCNCCIAFSPIGVAALSSPSMFADIFMNIVPAAGWSLGNSGNNFEKTGDAKRANDWIKPAFSPIFIKPSQSDRIPVIPSDISNPVRAESNVDDIIELKTSKSCIKINLQSATTKAISMNPIQI